MMTEAAVEVLTAVEVWTWCIGDTQDTAGSEVLGHCKKAGPVYQEPSKLQNVGIYEHSN